MPSILMVTDQRLQCRETECMIRTQRDVAVNNEEFWLVIGRGQKGVQSIGSGDLLTESRRPQLIAEGLTKFYDKNKVRHSSAMMLLTALYKVRRFLAVVLLTALCNALCCAAELPEGEWKNEVIIAAEWSSSGARCWGNHSIATTESGKVRIRAKSDGTWCLLPGEYTLDYGRGEWATNVQYEQLITAKGDNSTLYLIGFDMARITEYGCLTSGACVCWEDRYGKLLNVKNCRQPRTMAAHRDKLPVPGSPMFSDYTLKFDTAARSGRFSAVCLAAGKMIAPTISAEETIRQSYSGSTCVRNGTVLDCVGDIAFLNCDGALLGRVDDPLLRLEVSSYHDAKLWGESLLYTPNFGDLKAVGRGSVLADKTGEVDGSVYGLTEVLSESFRDEEPLLTQSTISSDGLIRMRASRVSSVLAGVNAILAFTGAALLRQVRTRYARWEVEVYGYTVVPWTSGEESTKLVGYALVVLGLTQTLLAEPLGQLGVEEASYFVSEQCSELDLASIGSCLSELDDSLVRGRCSEHKIINAGSEGLLLRIAAKPKVTVSYLSTLPAGGVHVERTTYPDTTGITIPIQESLGRFECLGPENVDRADYPLVYRSCEGIDGGQVVWASLCTNLPDERCTGYSDKVLRRSKTLTDSLTVHTAGRRTRMTRVQDEILKASLSKVLEDKGGCINAKRGTRLSSWAVAPVAAFALILLVWCYAIIHTTIVGVRKYPVPETPDELAAVIEADHTMTDCMKKRKKKVKVGISKYGDDYHFGTHPDGRRLPKSAEANGVKNRTVARKKTY